MLARFLLVPLLAVLQFIGCQQHAFSADDKSTAASYSLRDVLVAPTRILFEGRERTAQVALINRGDSERSYSIAFKEYRMVSDGSMETIDEETVDNRFASPYIRFTPRRVVLKPGQNQMVRMMLRKPSDLPSGEYRSHLSFSVIPDAVEAGSRENNEKGISIQLIPVYGVTIPVIARQGDLHADVQLKELELRQIAQPETQELAFVVYREGSQSVFGNVEVEWKAPGQKPVVVGTLNSVSVYTSTNNRKAAVRLIPPEGVVLRGGELVVRYRNAEEGKDDMLAEARLALP